ncbi:MAG: hypothetical protein RJA33_1334, partial [Actinomycetota bacterium]
MKKVLSAVVAVCALLISPAAQANTLVSSSPTSGQSLEAAPSAVTITTELPLMDAGNDVVVTDPSGIRVDDGTLTIAGSEAVVGLKN